jgi:hypothetical protein
VAEEGTVAEARIRGGRRRRPWVVVRRHGRREGGGAAVGGWGERARGFGGCVCGGGRLAVAPGKRRWERRGGPW